MAKLVITFENNQIKKELHFKNHIFDSTMKHELFGFAMSSDKPCFLAQYNEKFGTDLDEDCLLGRHLDNLDFGGDNEIEKAIEYLTELEDRDNK